MITTLLFDIGGTLLTGTYTQEQRIAYCARLISRLADYGIRLNVTPEALSPLLHENAESYKHWSEGSLHELPAARIWNEFYLKEFAIGEEVLAPIAEELSFRYDYERGNLMRRPRLKETMEELSAMGIRLGIITNMISTSFAPHILREYGIDRMMECVIMSSASGLRKPDAAIFRLAMETMGVGPEETGYVGDTLSRDIRGARNADLGLAVMIRNPAVAHRDKGLAPEGRLKPDYVIDELYELPDILRKINANE